MVFPHASCGRVGVGARRKGTEKVGRCPQRSGPPQGTRAGACIPLCAESAPSTTSPRTEDPATTSSIRVFPHPVPSTTRCGPGGPRCRGTPSCSGLTPAFCSAVSRPRCPRALATAIHFFIRLIWVSSSVAVTEQALETPTSPGPGSREARSVAERHGVWEQVQVLREVRGRKTPAFTWRHHARTSPPKKTAQ